MIIKNAKIVCEDKIIDGYIEFDEVKILKISSGLCSKKGFDAKGLYLLPAFFDSHTHGGYGFDFNQMVTKNYTKDYKNYLDNISKEGVAIVVGTTVTCPKEELIKISSNFNDSKTLDLNNIVKGWYIEGPFISKEKKGAHNEKYICPIDLSITKKIVENTKDLIKVIAIAPEVGNNLKDIKILKKDFIVAVGHSNASSEITEEAFKNGASRVTHLYNQTSMFHHRQPGIINAAINNNNLMCELVTDGFHVQPTVLLNTYNMLCTNQIMIITDSLGCKGLKNGDYMLGDLKIEKKDNVCYIKGTNTLAGTTMPFNLQAQVFGKLTKCNMIEFAKFTSSNAARNLKIDTKIGKIEKGLNSSFVLINNNYELKHTIINGNFIK